jgi:hypothetical protein
MKSTPDI